MTLNEQVIKQQSDYIKQLLSDNEQLNKTVDDLTDRMSKLNDAYYDTLARVAQYERLDNLLNIWKKGTTWKKFTIYGVTYTTNRNLCLSEVF